MNINYIKKKILKIKKKIKIFSYYYFNKNKSIISDEKYDLLLKKLEKLEKKYPLLKSKNSPTKNIYYKFKNNFIKKKHSIPMLSIKNFYSFKEIKKYLKRINKKYKINNFCCELKIDGMAISLIYKNNLLYKSLTRGDGIYGENVIKNIKYINSIPKNIKLKKNIYNIEIRGEIYISKKKFIKINKNKIFSNSRNIISGTVRNSNKKIIKKRKLSFIAYDIIINNNRKIFLTQYKSLKKINKLGFKIDKKTKLINNIKDIKKYYNKIKKIKKKIDFDIDGIVIKINNKLIQEKIKNNNKYIKWCIAWKFPSKKKITKVKNIIFKINKTGIIIPIIIIKKIKIQQVKIKKINLYNLNYLNKKKINIGDNVIIERSGNVIPKIIKIIKKNKKKYFINKCPFCKKKININEKIPKCYYKKCYKKIISKIIYFCSKEAFNIIGLGKNIIKKLVKYKCIKNIIDIFKISKKKLIKIPKIKNKLSNNIIESINLSKKKIKLNNIINSISIPNIGKYSSIKISKNINCFKEFINLNKKKIYKIENISKKKKKSIIKYLNNKKNIKFLKKLNKILFN